MYLTQPAIGRTLEEIGAFAPGTELITDYMLPPGLRDADGQSYAEQVGPVAAQRGEPWLTCLAPDEMSAALSGAGFGQIEHVSQRDSINAALWDRSDTLHPIRLSMLARGTVHLTGRGTVRPDRPWHGHRDRPRPVGLDQPWHGPTVTGRGTVRPGPAVARSNRDRPRHRTARTGRARYGPNRPRYSRDMPEIELARRQRLQPMVAALGADAALITSLPNVRYLTGLASSNAALLLPAAGGTRRCWPPTPGTRGRPAATQPTWSCSPSGSSSPRWPGWPPNAS